MSDFKKLSLWQKAHGLSLDVDREAARIRGVRHASLRSQMVRAAQSVPTNVVEGSGQRSAKEFIRFLRISLNSTNELEYHLIAARDLKAMGQMVALDLITNVIEVRKMTYGLIRYLTSKCED